MQSVLIVNELINEWMDELPARVLLTFGSVTVGFMPSRGTSASETATRAPEVFIDRHSIALNDHIIIMSVAMTLSLHIHYYVYFAWVPMGLYGNGTVLLLQTDRCQEGVWSHKRDAPQATCPGAARHGTTRAHLMVHWSLIHHRDEWVFKHYITF